TTRSRSSLPPPADPGLLAAPPKRCGARQPSEATAEENERRRLGNGCPVDSGEREVIQAESVHGLGGDEEEQSPLDVVRAGVGTDELALSSLDALEHRASGEIRRQEQNRATSGIVERANPADRRCEGRLDEAVEADHCV